MNHKQAQLEADHAGERLFTGCACKKCGTNRYYTPSGKCVKCVQLEAGATISQRFWEKQEQILGAEARFKDDIKYQAWGL